MDVVAHANEWSGGPGPWFGVFWLVMIGAIVATFFIVRRNSRGSASTAGPATTAESVLAERFARGDITDEDYLAKVSVLRSER